MRYIYNNSEFELEKASAVTLGKFDGLHAGHKKLISIVKEKAAEENLLSCVFTFDKLPLSICPQNNQHFITTNAERRAVCERFDVDVEVEMPFTKELLNMEAEDFIAKVIHEQLKSRYVVIGPDFRFGRGRRGCASMLVQYEDTYNYKTIVVEKERYQDREISSTYVRQELREGHIETVNVLLGRTYGIDGVVCHGQSLGRTFDTPTANIYPSITKLLPPSGVYASKTIVDGESYYSITNIGSRPTVSDSYEISVESNIFDFSGDLYGKKITVELVSFIRAQIKFDNIEILKNQIEQDIKFAKNMFLLDM